MTDDRSNDWKTDRPEAEVVDPEKSGREIPGRRRTSLRIVSIAGLSFLIFALGGGLAYLGMGSSSVGAGCGFLPGGPVFEVASDRSDVPVDALVDAALESARKEWSDAKLVSLSASNVSPDGTANLTYSSSDVIGLTFASLQARNDAPSRPKGASEDEIPCLYFSVMEKNVFRQRRSDLDNCGGYELDEGAVALPTCTTTEIWERAIAEGAPEEGAVATLYWDRNRNEWTFRIGEEKIRTFPDDCGD